MTAISDIEEFTRDWDWFAVDSTGSIGHFTSAGMRKLPGTVKSDNEAALRLIDYFALAPQKSGYMVTAQAELDMSDVKDKSHYLKSFVQMAAAGLFSYNTYVDRRPTEYFLVARPNFPLKIDDVPCDIRTLLQRTKSRRVFDETLSIHEVETHTW